MIDWTMLSCVSPVTPFVVHSAAQLHFHFLHAGFGAFETERSPQFFGLVLP